MLKNSQSVRNYFLELQNKITEKLQEQETVSFLEDQWNREEGGGGQSRILENGVIFEKAGINFSDVHGNNYPFSYRKTTKFGKCILSSYGHFFSVSP